MAAAEWMTEMSAALSGGVTRMPPFVQAWMAPQDVKISGDNLVWSVGKSARQRGVIFPEPGLLEQFLRLDSAPPEEIAKFARDFGVLCLCRHGSPWLWEHDTETGESGMFCKPVGREPLETWRGMARYCRTVLSSAEDIEAGRRLDQERYEILRSLSPFGGLAFSEEHPKHDRYVFVDGLNWFLRRAVTVGISFETARSTRPRMQFSGRSVIDAIALQLAMAVCRAESTAACDGCGKVYPRSRPGRNGQRNFCPECRRAGAPQKFANRDRRTRQHQQSEAE